jgi:hypothetical protein
MRLHILLSFSLALVGCKKAEPPVVAEKPAWEQSFDRGIDYLLSRQSEDGAWRSDVYGHFREGDALTPLVIVALQRAPDSEKTNAAIERGLAWMKKKFVRVDAFIDPESHFAYPVYTSALMVQALCDPRQQGSSNLRLVWAEFLLFYQMTEARGWQPTDPQYGGWGYSGVVPYRPKDGPVPEALEANISATAYALWALRAAGEFPDGERPAEFGSTRDGNRAMVFVDRCQNFSNDGGEADRGGFFFAPNDPFRNKAGSVDREAHHFRSYGSATADGMRCLAALGEDPAKLAAARKWFERHLPGDKQFHNAGLFAEDREPNRDAAHFYCAASLNDLIRAKLLSEGESIRGQIREDLTRRQLADGSWKNELNLVREDDPLLATALAVMALR